MFRADWSRFFRTLDAIPAYASNIRPLVGWQESGKDCALIVKAGNGFHLFVWNYRSANDVRNTLRHLADEPFNKE